MAEVQKIRVLTSAERAEESRKFIPPDPGNLMVTMIFGWALFCFSLVVTDGKLLRQFAGLTNNRFIKEQLLAVDATVLTALMLSGCVGIIVLVVGATRFKLLAIGCTYFGFTFGSGQWKLLHDIGMGFKYPMLVFYLIAGTFFLYKNFWRLIERPYLRLLFLYFVYVAVINMAFGGRNEDIWSILSDFSMIIGFSMMYLRGFDNLDSMEKWGRVMAYAGVVATLLHCMAPLTVDDYIESGRFKSMFPRATGFAVNYAPLVIPMFWLSMYEKRKLWRQFFVGAAIVALVIILWSGTRSATLGILVSVSILWWVFRTRIFIYMFLAACLGLVAQIFGTSDQQDFQALSDRFLTKSNVELGGGRFEVWAIYWELIVERPIFGYSFSGIRRGFVENEAVLEFVEGLGFRTSAGSAAHSVIIGTLGRYGLVGLFLVGLMFYFPIKRGIQIVRSEKIPQEEKQVIVLPIVLVIGISVIGIFEDCVSGTGRGTVVGYAFYPACIFTVVYGQKLLEKYEFAKSEVLGRKFQSGVAETSPESSG